MTQAELTKALLTTTDLGLSGATSSPAPTTDRPLPCDPANGKSLNQQVPATVRAGVDISDDPQQAAFAEEIRLYSDAATATSALNVAKAGLTCSTGSLRADDGTAVPVKIGAPKNFATDLAQDTKLNGLPIKAALDWGVTTKGETIDLAVIQVDRALVLYTFQALTSANLSDLPSPLAVMEAGLEKIMSS